MPATNAVKNEKPFSTGENFAELLEESFSSKLKEGSLVKGRIVSKNKDYVIVDVGLKTEGRISAQEFHMSGEADGMEVGDEIEVYLERFENREGEVVLSREKALREESWERFESAHKKNETVDGVIFGKVKGGFTVDLDGVVAFLPGSQVDVRPVRDIGPLMNIKQPFMILKMDRARGNIVVSRRAILEESRSAEREEILSKIAEGVVLEGMVKNITDYGAFIDLGAVDGLLHVTDISWRRVNHPSEVLSVGQTIKAKVIKCDPETKRISLGIKQLEDSPWQNIETRYPVGADHAGKVTNITDYGAFVELEPGVEGLVHVSEMSWVKKNLHPSKLLSTSQEVKVRVLEVDSVKHRISLGIKQCEENPWQKFAAAHKPGEVMQGEIRNVMDFGLFVGLTPDLDGLVHANDLSWSEKPDAAVKKYKKGETVSVKILALEPEKERISLGIKQLEKDPLSSAFDNPKLKKGAVLTFRVTAVNNDGIEVEVAEGLTAFIKRSELSADRLDQRPEKFAVGDRVDAKIVSLDASSRKVGLSIKAYELDEQKRTIAEFGSTDSGASLGDILGVALSSAKQKKGKAAEKEEGKTPAKKPAKSEEPKKEAKKSAAKAKKEPAKEEEKAEAKKKTAAKKPAAKKK